MHGLIAMAGCESAVASVLNELSFVASMLNELSFYAIDFLFLCFVGSMLNELSFYTFISICGFYGAIDFGFCLKENGFYADERK
jgi:hypothetical protein